MQINALAVAVAEYAEDDCFTVAFAEGANGGGIEMHFQVSISREWSISDVRCGFDTYSLTTETGATAYGGVTSWRVSEGCLAFELTDGAAAKLGVDPSWEIRFAAENTLDVQQGLERIFAPDPVAL